MKAVSIFLLIESKKSNMLIFDHISAEKLKNTFLWDTLYFTKYSIGGHFLFYKFCCKMETIDFFTKNPPNMPNVPKTAASKLKVL